MQTSVRNVGLSAPQTLYAQQFPDFMNCGTLQQSFCAAHNPISVPLKSLLTSGQLEILTAAGPSIAREQRCAAASEIFRSTGFPLNSAIWYQTVIKTFLSWRFLDLIVPSFSSQYYLKHGWSNFLLIQAAYSWKPKHISYLVWSVLCWSEAVEILFKKRWWSPLEPVTLVTWSIKPS